MELSFQKISSALFGILFAAIGVINTFWGNDTFYGLFVILLSLAFFPVFGSLSKGRIPEKFHLPMRILLGLFILWSSLGVGELFEKIRLMTDFFR